MSIAALIAAGAVSIGLAVLTLGTSLIADAGAAAGETGVMLAVAQALADAIGVEVAAMQAALDVAVTLAARWVVMFGGQIASSVTYNAVSAGDLNPIDANLGAAALSAGVLTLIPVATRGLAGASPVRIPQPAVRFAEGVVIDVSLEQLLGRGDISWTEATILGGGNVFLGKLGRAAPAGDRRPAATGASGSGRH
jgi:hypothetical protein